MIKPVFYPYKMHSNSSKLLAKAFGAERVKPDGKFMNNYKRPVINWGNSTTPEWMLRWKDQKILNHPFAVKTAANKLNTFEVFETFGVKHPEWTEDGNYANDIWLEEGFTVIARTTLVGKGGVGIELYNKENCILSADGVNYDDFNFNAPLYTKYFKKKHEYRVHVVAGKIIDFVMKKKREGVAPNYQIRNADNGWVFCREGVLLPLVVAEEAVKAVEALGLTFGAVDVGYNEYKQEPCVFEVNTAPGIEGQTVESYVKAFGELLK